MITITGDAYHSHKRGLYYIWNTTIFEEANEKRIYVGSSSDIGCRVRSHVKDLESRRHVRPGLQQDYSAGHHFEIGLLRAPRRFEDLLVAEQRQMDSLRAGGWALYNAAPAFVGDYVKADEEEFQRNQAHWDWQAKTDNFMIKPYQGPITRWSLARNWNIYFIDPIADFDWPKPDPISTVYESA